MTREEMARLLALPPLVSTPDLLRELRSAANSLSHMYLEYDHSLDCLLEGIDSLEGMWNDLRLHVAGELRNIALRCEVFNDAGILAGAFADMASCDDFCPELLAAAAAHLLGLYGLLVLAANEELEGVEL